ncbi:hypothetical protein D3C85_1643960 [compost metagenome]
MEREVYGRRYYQNPLYQRTDVGHKYGQLEIRKCHCVRLEGSTRTIVRRTVVGQQIEADVSDNEHVATKSECSL